MSNLNEMWSALEKYQPYADKNGHGESWKRMTTERTAEAAWVAYWGAGSVADIAQHSNYEVAADAAYDATLSAAVALHFAEKRDVDRCIANAIRYITKAVEVQS